MNIDATNIDKLILCSWRAVRRKIESGVLLSSEKTLCFLFAIELYKRIGDSLFIDFEYQCYGGLQGSSKYLDLLIYTNPSYKVAIEFKLPKKSHSGFSNQSENREAVYRDIARLHWLKSNGMSACFFIMAVDEDAYLNNKKIKNNPFYLTKQGHVINNNNLTVTGLSLSGVNCTFDWKGIKKNNNKYQKSGYYSWLKPIKL